MYKVTGFYFYNVTRDSSCREDVYEQWKEYFWQKFRDSSSGTW